MSETTFRPDQSTRTHHPAVLQNAVSSDDSLLFNTRAASASTESLTYKQFLYQKTRRNIKCLIKCFSSAEAYTSFWLPASHVIFYSRN